ncbi:MAG TPA: hypothetical protein EYP74_00215 [Anaerolineales bacterium]|nr:hypothetical protein [Anaerolineales bacterium]
MKILLLGVGLQGKATLHDLASSSEVTQVVAADANFDDLQKYAQHLNSAKITALKLDVRERDALSAQMKKADAVIVLLPQGFREDILRLAIKNKIHFIETSYALPTYANLGQPAEAVDIAILPECGLDPGIDLVLAGQAITELDEVYELHAYGTGVPEPAAANNAINYKISWTFSGVLSAYQRSAKMLKNGKVIHLTPSEMFSPENMHKITLDTLGEMEAYYNGDAVKYLDILGIRETTLSTGRYSLRWPGHAAFWKKMVQLGFLKEEPIMVNGLKVSPRQFVHDLIEPQIHYAPDERDVAGIRIDIRGLKDGKCKRIIYQMIDHRDLETGLLAMQRTVGYTASIAAQMLLRGDIKKRGLLTPTRDIPFSIFVDELKKRNIIITREETDC